MDRQQVIGLIEEHNGTEVENLPEWWQKNQNRVERFKHEVQKDKVEVPNYFFTEPEPKHIKGSSNGLNN